MGGLACFFAWTGDSELAEVASPTFNGRIEELPVVRPVWEFFEPDSGTVVVAKVASSVQLTFLLVGLIGLAMIAIGLFWLGRGLFPRPSLANS